MFAAKNSAGETVLNEAGRILIVSQDQAEISRLVNSLQIDNYQVHVASTEHEVVVQYDRLHPELILIDTNITDQAVSKLTENISRLSEIGQLPIIFLTENESKEILRECMQHGDVDTICKPYDDVLLKSRIRTFLRISRLERENNSQRLEIESHNKNLKSSYDVAIDVFEKVIHSDVLDNPGIKYSISPISIFNGDLLLAAYRPSGELQIMLGDFTGHGLSAALGTIPVADIFYGMTTKGFGIEEIIHEINQKIMKILPRGLFLAACLFEFDFITNKLSIWNAGLPDALIFDKNKKEVVYQFKSRNYPLGVSEDISFTNSVENYFVKKGERLILFTDGIVEARNHDGKLYGIDNVIQGLNGCSRHWVIEQVIENLKQFSDGKKQTDDTTVLEVCPDCICKPQNKDSTTVTSTPISDSNWRLNYIFEAKILKVYDPVPNMIQMIMEVQKLHCYKQDIFILIKELFVNALDHGLLNLSSTLKNGKDGFSKYVLERTKRLDALNDGQISISIKHTGIGEGGLLDVYITDTGKGFDTSTLNELLSNDSQYHSRGILMVDSICQILEYNEAGNQVHAQYQWRTNSNT
ncbi:MAG: SpoIIE family protein phosphatase [Thioalkalispiraceae bacterium]|jgi:serine phosphatase RsbU (regulator of sigma subunit)